MTLSVNPARTVLAAALAFAALPAFAGDPYTQTVFFGDSLTDAGYFRPLLPAAVRPVTGQFTTNPGFVWSQYLADYYGTSAAPQGNGQTGPNSAAGGARVGVDVVGPLGFIPSLVTQANRYLVTTGGRADPNALYTVWGGANDLFAAAAAPAQANAIIGAAVTAQIGIVGTLKAAGAQYILVPTIPDLGLTPQFRAGGAPSQGAGTALSSGYNNALFSGLAASGLSVIPVDTYHFLQEVVANPAQFGLTNVTGVACLPPGSSSLTCNPTSYASPDAPFTYLFADGVHPTTGAHKAVSDLALNALEGPRQIAILPHSVAMVGRARNDMVASELQGRPLTDEDKPRWWSSVRLDDQRYGPNSTADTFDGGGPTLTVGVDWKSNSLVYGGFVGYGQQSIDFGLRRGNFDQTDTSIGGYVGWSSSNGAWVNGVVSYSQVGLDVHRRVPLGNAVRYYNSDVDASNISGGVNAGWTFTHGNLTHGPVLGLLAQRIDIDGFNERNPTESTSLAFREQNENSLIGTAGWRVNYFVNRFFSPYAQLTYDREFEDTPAQAFARSQSVVGSLEYAVPGQYFDRSYGTLTYGSQSQFWGLNFFSGSAVTIGQKGGNNSSFYLTVGKAF